MDFNDIQCFYTNADSLPNKLGELMTRIQDGKNSYEVIGITEMYPKNCSYLPGTSELQMFIKVLWTTTWTFIYATQ
jgi:hypothetical protein